MSNSSAFESAYERAVFRTAMAYQDKWEAIRSVVAATLEPHGYTREDVSGAGQAFADREKQATGAIGGRIAFVEHQYPAVTTEYVGWFLLQEDLLWPKSIDGGPVRLIVCVVGNPSRRDQYIEVFEAVFRCVHDRNDRRTIMDARSESELRAAVRAALDASGGEAGA